jgi:threonine dehydratase
MILQARKRLEGVVLQTPLEPSPALSAKSGSSVFVKWESLQRTGVFKLRGAYNKIASLSPEMAAQGVITASTGNHGLAVAYAAQQKGVPASIVVPKGASPLKVGKCESYGATVIYHGANYDEAAAYSRQLAEETGATLVHAYADPMVIAGQGTIGVEVLASLPNADTLLVPIGGGGLVSGIAIWVKTVNPKIRVIGIQSTATRAFYENYHAGRLFEVPIESTIADGLAGNTEQINLDIGSAFVDDVVLVEESGLIDAIRWTIENERRILEPAGVVGVAAIIQGKIQLQSTARVVIIASGSNLDPALLSKIC